MKSVSKYRRGSANSTNSAQEFHMFLQNKGSTWRHEKKIWDVVGKVRKLKNSWTAGFQGNKGCKKVKFSDFLASWGAFVVCERLSTRDQRSEVCEDKSVYEMANSGFMPLKHLINTHQDMQMPGSSLYKCKCPHIITSDRVWVGFTVSFLKSAKVKRTAVVFQRRDGPSLL